MFLKISINLDIISPYIVLVLHANNIQNLNEFSRMEPSHAVRDSPKRGGEIAVVCLELDLTHFPPSLPLLLPPVSLCPPLLMHANKSGTAWRDRQGVSARIYPIARARGCGTRTDIGQKTCGDLLNSSD